jgi:hypothetical protein
MEVPSRPLPAIAAMIPVAEKDMNNVSACVNGILRHSRNPVSEVYVIGAARLRQRLPADCAARWVDEERVHPCLDDVRSALHDHGYRHDSGSWYFQQLLKLCVFSILQPAADRILIHDADVALVKDTLFVDGQGRSLLAYGYPLHWRVNTRQHALPTEHSALTAAARLVPGWKAVDGYSGMQHHMMLERSITENLISLVEAHHRLDFWQAFIGSIEKKKWHGISEYVIYRHFAACNYPEATRSRHIDSIDIIEPAAGGPHDLADLLRAGHSGAVSLVGCHRFTDYEGTLASMDYLAPIRHRKPSGATPPIALLLDQGLLRIEVLDGASTPDGIMRLFQRKQDMNEHGWSQRQ